VYSSHYFGYALNIKSPLIMNEDQLFDNYLVMFIMWLRSKNLERKSRKFLCGLQKTAFHVRKSVHHHTIQIIQPTGCNTFKSLLLDVCVWLNMFREYPRPSSGAYNCTRSLWFYRWREAAGALFFVVLQTTTNDVPAASLQR
jgi:hypothetical protein